MTTIVRHARGVAGGRTVIGGPRMLPHMDNGRAAAAYWDLGKVFWPVVGGVNVMAWTWCVDAFDTMDDAGMLRQDAKRQARQAEAAWDAYIRDCRGILNHPAENPVRGGGEVVSFAFWQDMCRLTADKARPDVVKLYYAIKQLYDNAGDRRSALKAQVLAAKQLTALACVVYDGVIMHYQQRTLYDLGRHYSFGRLTAVNACMKRIAATMYADGGAVIRLDDDARCTMAMQVLENRFASLRFLDGPVLDALKLNPDRARLLDADQLTGLGLTDDEVGDIMDSKK